MYFRLKLAKKVINVQRLLLLKSCKFGQKDQVVVIDNNEAFGLIDSGVAIKSKDMTMTDYNLKSDEEQADGKHTKLRTYRPGKR